MRSKCAIRRADRGGGLGADVPAPEAGAGGGVEGTLGNGPRAERGMPPLIVDVGDVMYISETGSKDSCASAVDEYTFGRNWSSFVVGGGVIGAVCTPPYKGGSVKGANDQTV